MRRWGDGRHEGRRLLRRGAGHCPTWKAPCRRLAGGAFFWGKEEECPAGPDPASGHCGRSKGATPGTPRSPFEWGPGSPFQCGRCSPTLNLAPACLSTQCLHPARSACGILEAPSQHGLPPPRTPGDPMGDSQWRRPLLPAVSEHLLFPQPPFSPVPLLPLAYSPSPPHCPFPIRAPLPSACPPASAPPWAPCIQLLISTSPRR